ncbi:XRE family transcriptional regulator [Niallia taxi]|nr:XRE family transcriptional regulator [Niallia taxi]MDE5051743.1 XRE family transcriptional regulator [Niallia taxi]
MIDRDLPLKREIAENIKSLMKANNWTQLKTSQITGISKSTLSDYINCKTLINVGNVEKLAIAFKVPKSLIDPSFERNDDDLNSSSLPDKDINKENKLNEEKTTEIKQIPIVGNISLKQESITFEKIIAYKDIPKSWLKDGNHFLLRAKGNSMIHARIQSGDLLLIRIQNQVKNGDIAAVLIDGTLELKRVYVLDHKTILLQNDNPDNPPILIENSNNIDIIGKLVYNLITY